MMPAIATFAETRLVHLSAVDKMRECVPACLAWPKQTSRYDEDMVRPDESPAVELAIHAALS